MIDTALWGSIYQSYFIYGNGPLADDHVIESTVS